MSGVAREFIGENWPTIGVIAAICAGQGIWLGGLAVVLPALLAGIWLYTLFRQAQQARLSEEENHEIPVLTIERDVNALVEDSSQMIAGELTTVRQELDQVRVLVNEAITTLNSSFTGLNDESQREAQLVMSIMEDMSGGEAETGESDQPGFSGQGEADRGAGVTGEEADGAGQITIKRFSEETSVVLQYFVDMIVEISHKSVGTVNRIDDMARQMDEIFSLLSDVKHIADQTNLLALNAAIEAARAGDAGRGFAVVASEVRKLSEHSAQFNAQIRIQVVGAKDIITETRKLVADMAAQDMNVAITAKGRVDKMMQELHAMNESTAEKLAQVSTSNREIDLRVGEAIRSLQFEDMVNQLLQHTFSRVERLESLVATMQENLGQLKDAAKDEGGNYATAISSVQTNIARLKENWQSEVISPVAQQSMDEGDIELF